MLHSNGACEPQLLSPRPGAHALQQQKPPQREAYALQLEKALMRQRRPSPSAAKNEEIKVQLGI